MFIMLPNGLRLSEHEAYWLMGFLILLNEKFLKFHINLVEGFMVYLKKFFRLLAYISQNRY